MASSDRVAITNEKMLLYQHLVVVVVNVEMLLLMLCINKFLINIYGCSIANEHKECSCHLS